MGDRSSGREGQVRRYAIRSRLKFETADEAWADIFSGRTPPDPDMLLPEHGPLKWRWRILDPVVNTTR